MRSIHAKIARITNDMTVEERKERLAELEGKKVDYVDSLIRAALRRLVAQQ